jgi:phosphoribosylamine--glycine ligase
LDFMNSVLIIGSGGREHAILKALLRSDRPLCMYAYPGNPGMERDGCMLVDREIKNWNDLADWASENEIDLTIVGPEAPLVDGVVDIFRKENLTIFGPAKAAAEIEGSKAFAKDLMKKYKIPTADFSIFDNKESALSFVHEKDAPVVVKVSGLAGGKGAIVCDTKEEAEKALVEIFDDKRFGVAGTRVVIEEKMIGEEASVFVITDGKKYRILPVSQDHKAVGDGDTGPNTGGMGAYAPAPLVDDKLLLQIEKEIIKPVLKAMELEGRKYQGLLYYGIMVTSDGPKVVEFNCRFGDPETQAVLPLVSCDWYELFKSCANGKMTSSSWTINPGYCVSVILASQGYPGNFEKGKVITGIEETEREKSNVDIYHSGTALNNQEQLVTNGGRVLAVSAWDDTLEKAIKIAYQAVDGIDFEGKHYRCDIAAKGLARIQMTENSSGKLEKQVGSR